MDVITPRDAASLIILREGASEFEVLMGRRRSSARFGPGVYVFPGGALAPFDEQAIPASPLRPEIVELLKTSCTTDSAQALAMAAVRETFEETGIVIGQPGDVGDIADDGWQGMREIGMAPALERLDYVGRAITPKWQRIRFHARFFLTDAGSGEVNLSGDGELADLDWYPYKDALQLPLMDVTSFMLTEVVSLLRHGSDNWSRRIFTYTEAGPLIRDDKAEAE